MNIKGTCHYKYNKQIIGKMYHTALIYAAYVNFRKF